MVVTNTLKAHKRLYSNNINMTTSKSEKNTDVSESSYFDKKSNELSSSGTTTKSVERRLDSIEERLGKSIEAKVIDLSNRLIAIETRLGIKPTA